MIRRNKPKNGNNKGTQLPTNQKEYWWEARASIVKEQAPDQITSPTVGRPPKFKSPEILWKACTEYFKWVQENPLIEDQVFCYKGKIIHANRKKMLAMTSQGLCIFLGSMPAYWYELKNNRGTEFTIVCLVAEAVIYNQKFTGAAAALLKESIIARDLGLKDRHEHTGPGGGPIRTQSTPADLSQLSDKEMDIIIALAGKLNNDKVPNS